LVERFSNKIKHCRRIVTRYDKLAANYLAFVLLGRMLAAVRRSYGVIARIGRANRIAACAANFVEAHLKTAHAATFVIITASAKPCAPRTFIVCITRRTSHCESEERQKSYFSHVRFHVLLVVGDWNSTSTVRSAAVPTIAVRHFDSRLDLKAPGNEETVK
jgi:hypothetical protein